LTKDGARTYHQIVSATAVNLAGSRERLIHLLRSRGGVNADALAQELGVSRQCVRKHLDVLERDGYVEHRSERKERGRPAHVYRLTAKAATELFPKRYDLLARSVLQQIKSVWGERGLNTIFCGCATEMVGRFRPRLKGLGFDQRVRRLAELLDEEGYEAEVEKLSDGSFILSEWNCPLTDVARDYRQLCERELEVYRELLETEVFRESRIAGGASRCVYRVLRPKRK
jgi:predicted ArsR family transcriptional regulator